MKPCAICHEVADVDFLERCEKCFRNYLNMSDALKPNTLFAMVQLKDGKTLSSAHYKDILSRKAQPDGSVIRNTNRKFI